MSVGRWAGLLDDEGIEDSDCLVELEELKSLLVQLRDKDCSQDNSKNSAQTSCEVRTPVTKNSGVASANSTSNSIQQRLDLRSCSLADASTDVPLRDLSSFAVWSVSSAKSGNGVEQLLESSTDTYWQSDGAQPHWISAQFSSKLKLSEVQLFFNYEQDESYTPSIISISIGSSFQDLRVICRNKEFLKPQGWCRVPLTEPVLEDSPSQDEDSLLGDDDDIEGLSGGELAERELRRRARVERRIHRAKVIASRATLTGSTGITDPMEKIGADDMLALPKIREARRDKSFVRAHMLRIIIHCNHQNGRDSHVRQVKVLGPAQQIAGYSALFSSVPFQMYETIR